MNLYKITSQILVYTAMISMLLAPVAQAKSQAGLSNQIGLKSTVNIQNKGLAGLKDLNAKALLSGNKSKNNNKSQQVTIEQTDEELLSKLSQDIYWKLKNWKESKTNQLLDQSEKQTITQWLVQLNSLQAKVNINLNKLTSWITDKNLSAIIMQRQQEAISKVNNEINGLKQQLSNLNQANSLSSTNQRLTQSFDFFANKQLKRQHQVFDGLSSVALTPDRIPVATKAADFAKYKFPVKSKAIQKAADFTNPIYLGTSDEVVINQFIQDKVTELENDPVKIYHWVHNNIEWLPSYGAIQASDITLGSGRGNAFDQSSLLIAMLRAANVPCRYAYGTIEVDIDKFTNWVGLTNPEAALTFVQYGAVPISPVIEAGVITKIRMEHIWVEAAIDFNPSRGAKNITPDSWVALDASFKQYEVLTGLDPIAISGQDMNQISQDFINSGTTNETDGWVHGFDPSILTTAQAQMQASLEQHIDENLTDPTVGDVIGGRRTIVKEFPTLPASTQIKILFKASDFAEMQDIMRPKYRLAFDKDILGDIVNPLELNFAQLNNHKLTLSFKPATETDEQALAALIPENAQSIEDLPTSIPAHLIRVIPQVALDEVVVKSGSPMFLGYDLTLYYQVQFSIGGTLNKEYRIPAGSYVNLMFGAGSVSLEKLDNLTNKINNTKGILESNDPNLIGALTDRSIFGDMFDSGSISYIAEYNTFNSLIGKQLGSKFNLSPVFGTYGFEPNVGYLFGVPININQGGIGLNIYTTRQIASNDNSLNSFKQFNQSIGMLTSILEHAIPEQQLISEDLPGEAISTIKALEKAMSEGQKIYEISQTNITQLSNIHFHPETMNEITNAVNAGYTVITHTDNVSIPGWAGSGYIISNPNAGDGAYKISGGSNGGFLIFLGFLLIAVALIILVGFAIGGLLAAPSLFFFFEALAGGIVLALTTADTLWQLDGIWQGTSGLSTLAIFVIIISAAFLGIAATIGELAILSILIYVVNNIVNTE